MAKIVLKAGGSVLTDESAYAELAQRLQGLEDQIYVVVSARKGRTDELIEEYAKGSENRLKAALKGEERFIKMDNAHAASYLLSGEIDSARMLARHIPYAALFVQDEHFPIVANSGYLSAEINYAASCARSHALDHECAVSVISGFGAVNEYGEQVLLGRNSSDVVAAMIATLTKADRLIYLKDVEGVYENFGSPEQMMLEELTIKHALDMGEQKVLDSRVLGIVADCKMEVVLGHYKDLEKLVSGDRGYGTRIVR